MLQADLLAIAPNVDVLIVSRVIVGLAIGLTSVAAPMYIAELSPARNRGKLVSLFQLAITVGIVSLIRSIDLSPDHAWRWMLGLATSLARSLVLGMSRCLNHHDGWLKRGGKGGTTGAFAGAGSR